MKKNVIIAGLFLALIGCLYLPAGTYQIPYKVYGDSCHFGGNYSFLFNLEGRCIVWNILIAELLVIIVFTVVFSVFFYVLCDWGMNPRKYESR